MIRELTPAQMLALDFGTFMDRVKEEVDADRARKPSRAMICDDIEDRVEEAGELLIKLEVADIQKRNDAAELKRQLLARAIEIAAFAARLAIEGDPAYAASFVRPGSLAFPEGQTR